MCVICRKRFDKADLTRFITDSQGLPVADTHQFMPGRGFYCCANPHCQTKFASYRPKRKAGNSGKGIRSQGGFYDRRKNQG